VDFARLRGIPVSVKYAGDLAKQFGTSVYTMVHTRDIIERATPNISKMISDGTLKLRQADRISKHLPRDQQRRITTEAQAERALEKIKPGRFTESATAQIILVLGEAATELRERDPCAVLSALQMAGGAKLTDLESAIAKLTALHDLMADALRDPVSFRNARQPEAATA
jgi:hypothetical protein